MEWREHFWTIVLSVIFTLLLWLWAESENRETYTYNTRVTAIAVGPDANNLRVRFVPTTGTAASSEGVEVALTMQGSRVALQRAESRLRELTISISGLADNTEPTIDLSVYLAQLPIFDDLGLSFQSVDPPQVTARVDQFVTRAVEIKPDFPGIRVEQYTVDPPTAEITMTRTNWDLMTRLYGDNLLNVTVPNDGLRNIAPGESRRITGEIDVRRELQDVATLESPTGTVLIDVKPELVIDEIEMSFYIKVQAQPIDLAVYDVTIPEASQRINRVKFTGDAAMIRKLRDRDREWRPSAVVDLSREDLDRGATTGRVEIQPIPPGVTVSFPDLPEGQQPTVPLQITRREEEEQPSE